MIDEKKLIESLKTDFYEHYSINHSTDEKDLFEMFIDNINEQPKLNEWIPVEKNPDQTIDFKHFKLYGDNTLKNMNKEELVSYIHMLYRNWASCDKTCQNLINHAKKLSDSNDELRKQLYFCEPYRFEDLYEGMWVWDDKWEEAKNIRKIQLQDCFNKRWICFTEGGWLEFEEGRFFPVPKAMQYQEEIKEMKRKDYKKDE